MTDDEQADPRPSSERDRALQALLAFASTQHALGRHFARAQGMHPTDAHAIVEILDAEARGERLTPARLAERIGLSTGATSTLLNRLEQAGHLQRQRGHRDRRVVTLHSTAAIHDTADAFYRPLSARLQTILADYSDGELGRVAVVADRLRAAIDAHVHSTPLDRNGDFSP